MPMPRFAIVRNSEAQIVSPSENPIKDYILRVMAEDGLRPVDVLENAKRLKIKLRQATFAEVYAGQTKNPGIFTLIKISKALGRPFEEMVAEIQGEPPPSNSAFRHVEILSGMYGQMGAKERKIADRFLDMVKREFASLLGRNVRSE